MDGGDVCGWVTMSLPGLLAMSNEVLEVLYGRHDGLLTLGVLRRRIGDTVAEEGARFPLSPFTFSPRQALKQWRNV